MLSSVGGWRSPLIAVALSSGLVLGSVNRVAAAAPPAGATEPPIAATGVEGDYLRTLHERIHRRWADGFVATSAHTLPASDALNDRARQAVVLFSVRWDGSLTEASLVGPSGAAPFDRAAVESIRKGTPFPVPPADLLSDDGLAHFRWTLARDARLCAGGELRRREDPLEESIPRLVGQGRGQEALLRVARSLRAGDAVDALAIFARAWLARPSNDPVADAQAAAALAGLGDAGQARRLQAALDSAETAAAAGDGLRALKVDVCPLVAARLGAADARARQTALLALHGRARRDAVAPPAGASAEPSPCTAPVAALLSDAALAVPVRVMAAETLAGMPDAGARAALAAAEKEADPMVRAAAVRLSARPSGGRPALYRIIPFVHDPAVEVRAAAAAAMLRCCGDLALPELVLVFKESDPRPALAVADELSHAATEASADFLGRMLKRPDPQVRRAVAAALAARSDARAQALLAAYRRASQQASPQTRGGATEQAPAAAPPTFEALLAANRAREAAEWVVAELDRLPPRRRIEVLAGWLARPRGDGSAPVSAQR